MEIDGDRAQRRRNDEDAEEDEGEQVRTAVRLAV